MTNSKEQKARRIAALLAGYMRDTLTPAEHDELDEWVGASDRNMRLFEELTDEKRVQLALELLKDENEQSVLKELQETDDIVYTRRPLFRRINRYAVAASIILVAGTIAFLVIRLAGKTNQPADNLVTTIQPEEILPTQYTATLTLDDGRTIDLGKIQDGTIATEGPSLITKQDGALTYSPSGAVQNTRLDNTVTTPRGGKFFMTLSDGSKAWLSPGSSISYPAAFISGERRVSITGEVFFDVASARHPGPNYQHPFIVEVKDKNMAVEVLGTQFNINAYGDEPVIKTTLVEGAVKIAAGSKTTTLRPGQEAQVAGNGEIAVVQVETEKIEAKKDGMLQLGNTEVGEVMKEISRWYNIEISYENNSISNRLFSTAILNLNNDFSTTLRNLETHIGNVKFRIEGRKMVVTSS